MLIKVGLVWISYLFGYFGVFWVLLGFGCLLGECSVGHCYLFFLFDFVLLLCAIFGFRF